MTRQTEPGAKPEPEAEPVLVLRDVKVGHGRPPRRSQTVLAGINASLRSGQLACLIGPNGCGKSTLLRSVIRAQPLLGGEVGILGKSIAEFSTRELARHVAVVLTDRVAAGRLRGARHRRLGTVPAHRMGRSARPRRPPRRRAGAGRSGRRAPCRPSGIGDQRWRATAHHDRARSWGSEQDVGTDPLRALVDRLHP